ncbi:putative salicylate hydroxylase [Xylogone sp. PMI_703]|nr:putative salicylate hydroxylase [Xylogone sp. PMI_703]
MAHVTITSYGYQGYPKQKSFSIAIVGGGISGLCLAIGLIRHNVPVHIYEAAPQFAEIGAGMSIGPSGCMSLHLLDPALSESFAKLATKHTDNPGWENKVRVWMQYRYGQDAELLTEVSNKIGQTSVHRAEFLDALVGLIPDGITSFGKKLRKVEESDQGVKLFFEDKSTVEATFVIRADGIKSRVRDAMLGPDTRLLSPEYSGTCVYRGIIPMAAAVKAVGKERAMLGQMYLGNGGYVVTYPIQHGTSINLGAFTYKKEGPWERHGDWISPNQKEAAVKDFSTWSPSVKALLNLLENPSMWATFNMPLIPSNTKGRICLIGDAAHATTPHQGSGCGAAIEDAFILSQLIGDERVQSESGIFLAFQAYDAICRPRAQRIITTSRECGDLLALRDPMIGDDKNLIIQNLQQRYSWIWEQDMEDLLKRARELMIKLAKDSELLSARI